MRKRSGALWPVAIAGSKFFFAADAASAARYRAVLSALRPAAKRSTVFGFAVLCDMAESPTLRRRLTGSVAWGRLRGTALGQVLLQLKRLG